MDNAGATGCENEVRPRAPAHLLSLLTCTRCCSRSKFHLGFLRGITDFSDSEEDGESGSEEEFSSEMEEESEEDDEAPASP